MNKKLMQGTFWLTFANLLCKVLGVVYLIPWLSMMGNNQDGMLATTLYNVGYLPYGFINGNKSQCLIPPSCLVQSDFQMRLQKK